MFTTGAENYIRRLRIVGDVDDSLAFQLRLQSLLSSADYSIPGVSPASIVCIRSLPDPRPRTLRLVRNELESGAAWRDALTESIAGKVSRAARPASGAVLDNAECVLFADKAEMLACVANDWLTGLLGARWWWQILLQAGHPSEVVKQLWREHPQYVPAALDQLQRQQKAAAFANALTQKECRELLQRTVRSFAIQELAAVCEVELSIVRPTPTDTTAHRHTQADDVSHSVTARATTSPWEPWCNEPAASDFSPERRRFLGIVLTILRSPSHARTIAFAKAVERWQEEIIYGADDVTTTLPPLTSPPADPPASRRHQEILAEDPGDRTSPQVTVAVGDLSQQPQPKPANRVRHSRQQIKVRAESTPTEDSNAFDDRVGLRVGEHASPESITTPRQQPIGDQADAPAQSFAADDNRRSPITLDAVSESPWVEIDTQLGGCFYLINLALYLKLYGDFTRPRATVIELNLWDFVALVGRELVADDYAEDPVWSLLAKMSAREADKAAGESFNPSDEWRLPPEWLQVLPATSPWRWSTTRGRLRVEHPDGFTVLELPMESDVQAQLHREIGSYGLSSTAMTRARLRKPAPVRATELRGQAARWLSLLMPYVRARLRVALGCESEAAAAAMLCRHYARVRSTDTHVDVFFALSDLPLPIRFAGLDRDPGWVPAAGRSIAFHFE